MSQLAQYALPIALGTAAVATPLWIALADYWRRKTTDDAGRWYEEERMPTVLRDAVIFMNEQSLSISSPVRLSGRVDQVYLISSGLLVPVDTKVRERHRVYDSDIMQLSIYAMILAHTSGRRISNAGYVRTVKRTERTRDVRYHLVPLHSDKVILESIKN